MAEDEAQPVEVKSSQLPGQNRAGRAQRANGNTRRMQGPKRRPGRGSGRTQAVPDDLKQLKGVGPKLEQKLHEAGVTTFAQIAAWTAERYCPDGRSAFVQGHGSLRDGWVAQAKTLAGGGETEFSKRVEDGDVY